MGTRPASGTAAATTLCRGEEPLRREGCGAAPLVGHAVMAEEARAGRQARRGLSSIAVCLSVC